GQLDAVVRRARRVHVAGPAGAGKTMLVASWTGGADTTVFWHAFAPRLGGALPGLLLELGEHLLPGDPSLASYLRAALPRADLGLAARIALASLRREPRLLVLDDFDAVARDASVEVFLDAVARLPSATIVTVGRGRGRPGIPCVSVPALSANEVAALLALRGAGDDPGTARHLHCWTGGNVRLVDAAAACLTGSPEAGRETLLHAAGDHAALVRTAARLMWSARGRAA
nr:hypothetical protein [Actinomycetota bacterium]